MRYLICQDWENTTNNHAGMKHMSNLLKSKFPDEYKVHVFADRLGNKKRNLLGKIEWRIITMIINPLNYFLFGLYLSFKLKEGDQVFLLEYMEKITPQNYIARVIKTFKPKIKVWGLVHLTPLVLENAFGNAEIQRWTKPIDKILTMGSSLSSYFIKMGLPQSKISTLFHYVDFDYYTGVEDKSENEGKISVIAMGNQKRNFNVLSDIVKDNPHVSFIICKGVSNIDNTFSSYENVKLIDFVSEDKLKELMQAADVSLNVMDDTIGSNVITTSMAMGLAMIVSDVGSIRDYCKEDGAIYCKNEDVTSFSQAIGLLDNDRIQLKRLKQKSLELSQFLSVYNLHSRLKLL